MFFKVGKMCNQFKDIYLILQTLYTIGDLCFLEPFETITWQYGHVWFAWEGREPSWPHSEINSTAVMALQ